MATRTAATRKDGRVEKKVTLRGWDGKIIRRVSVYGENTKAANDAADKLKADHAKGLLTRPGTKATNVAQLHDLYLESLQARRTAGKISTATLESYEGHFRVHVVSQLGELKVCDVTTRDIEHVVSRPNRNGSAKSGSTRRKIYLACLQAWSLAVREGIAPVNVVAAMKDSGTIPHQESVSPPPATPHEVEIMIKAAQATDNQRMETAIRVMADTGYRRVELLGIQYLDIRLEARRLAARTSKTKAGVRVQTINDNLAAYLETLGEHDPQEYLIPNDADPFRPMAPREFNRALARVAARAGIHLTSHQFKHGVGTQLGHLGIPQPVLSSVLGQKDPRMLAVYVEAIPTASVEVMNLLSLTPPVKGHDA